MKRVACDNRLENVGYIMSPAQTEQPWSSVVLRTPGPTYRALRSETSIMYPWNYWYFMAELRARLASALHGRPGRWGLHNLPGERTPREVDRSTTTLQAIRCLK